MKAIGIILICVGIGVALAQIIGYHRWEWGQMLSLWHHEGIAWVAVVLGLLLVLSARRRKTVKLVEREEGEGSN